MCSCNDPHYERFIALMTEAATGVLERRIADVKRLIRPGELGCLNCRHVASGEKFHYGLLRFGENPSRRYCPACGQDISGVGWLDGDAVAAVAAARELAEVG